MVLLRVLLPKEDPYGALVAHIARSTEETSVLVVEARIAASRLRELVATAGGDVSHLHIIDATGSGDAMGPGDELVTNVTGPHMLELIALRTKQLAVHKAERRVTVIVDDMLAFGRTNEAAALVEIIQQARTVHDEHNTQEYAVHPDVPQEMQDRLQVLLDGDLVLDPDGASV